MEINSLLFALLLLIYSVFSFFTFLATTDGSGNIAEFVINPLPMLVNLSISPIGVVLKRQYFCNPKIFFCFILTISLVHLACLTFNTGSIGLANRNHAFYYETVLAGRPGVFGMQGHFPQTFQNAVCFYLRLAYYICIFIFLVYLISSRR